MILLRIFLINNALKDEKRRRGHPLRLDFYHKAESWLIYKLVRYLRFRLRTLGYYSFGGPIPFG